MTTITTVLRRNYERSKKRIPVAQVIQGTVLFVFIVFLWGNLRGFQTLKEDMQLQTVDNGPQNSFSFNKNLRKYPPHRYYKLNLPRDQQPDFLTKDTEYIYGEWPIILQPVSSKASTHNHGPFKLAVDQSSWLPNASLLTTLPFADGTNPSIISMDRLVSEKWNRVDWLQQHFPEARYLATICMTNSQCTWNDTREQIQTYRMSRLKAPITVRTVLLILDEHFQSLAEASVYLRRDAGWGRKARQPSDKPYLPDLDDARLFLHNHLLYVSYREGPGFGYETQVLNPVHIEMDSSSTPILTAHIKASETSSICCGRNMALMKGRTDDELKALTWVDPVTTITVDTTSGAKSKRRKLSEKKKNKSHIHGTNGFMVDIPSVIAAEDGTLFLGVAHFHRPHGRQDNPYARFGHHYTHAFYLVRNDQLVGLSPEFVLPSKYDDNDAEIIQFLSGLEYDPRQNEIIIAYGINDCEAAVAVVALDIVRKLILPVEEGKQVVDFMMPLS